MHKRWHKEDIKAAIRKRTGTMAAFADKYELRADEVRHALSKPRPSIQRMISSFLDVPLHKLWPDFYRKDGSRILTNVGNTSTNLEKCSRPKSSEKMTGGDRG